MKSEIISQNRFVAGELGPYLLSSADLPIYVRGAKTIENMLVLPHGGVDLMRGTEYVAELIGINADATRLYTFSFNREQEYTLLFSPLELRIFRNFNLVAGPIATPYLAEELAQLRFVQSADTLLIFYSKRQTRQLRRAGSDTNWVFTTWEPNNITRHRYNLISTLTPSGTTGSITLTLNVPPSWKAGHAAGGRIFLNNGSADINGFPQLATGGTPLSSSGTPANAFDNNASTTCNAGTNGWIGYSYSSAQITRIVAVRPVSTTTFEFRFEGDVSASFPNPVNLGSTTVTIPSGTWGWVDVPVTNTAFQHFRIRATNGVALNVQDVIFASGLIANATVVANLSSTSTAQAGTWRELGWSTARGFPAAGTFFENRLIVGGTIDGPSTVFISYAGNANDFDNTATTAEYGASFTIASDRIGRIRDMKSKRNINIFTTDGEYEMSGGDLALSPTNVICKQQSAYGISDVPVLDVEDELMFFTNNYKELRSFVYQLATDKYIADNKTILAHHLFQEGTEPFDMAYLRGYRDTQANYLFVSREDGSLAILCVDAQRNVLAWSRRVTSGLYRSLCVTNTTGADGRTRETLFVVVQRRINGTNRVFLEALTEANTYLDHFYVGDNPTPQTTWSGLNTLIGETVTAVGDSFVLGEYVVNDAGSITVSTPVSFIEVGLKYTAKLETMDITPISGNITRRGQPIRKIRAIATLVNSKQLTVDGIRAPFRKFGNNLLDAPLVPFTGTKEVRLRGWSKDQHITITTNEPLPFTLLSISVEVAYA